MPNIKLTIEYDGTNYSGWQIQPNAVSIQEELQKAIKKITGEAVNINGSGRTDAGVHARGQIANFITKSKIPSDRFAFALNSALPYDIVIKNSEEVDESFHARFSAKGKMYSYTLINSKFPTAIMRNFAYHISYCEKLDIEALKKAAEHFVGTYDFYGFMSTGSEVKDTIRTIYDINIEVTGEIIKIAYVGNGFLYNMVRILTGTILYAAIGKLAVDEIPRIIESKNRSRAGITVPAKGLCLEKVLY